ncbi:conserved protein of unknown function [Magnetospira sp. QH-2]|nr:conserved protein of unknown function [Magnetospira sp. QH-2]
MDVIWWITAVELPALAGLFWLIWRTRKEAEDALDRSCHEMENQVARVREGLSAYKLEVAKSYASISHLKDVEKRLTDHLIRIEDKLDGAIGGA